MAEQKKSGKLLGLMKTTFQRPGQSLGEFAQEYKQLSDADKAWYAEAFKAEGYTVEDYS